MFFRFLLVSKRSWKMFLKLQPIEVFFPESFLQKISFFHFWKIFGLWAFQLQFSSSANFQSIFSNEMLDLFIEMRRHNAHFRSAPTRRPRIEKAPVKETRLSQLMRHIQDVKLEVVMKTHLLNFHQETLKFTREEKGVTIKKTC